MARVRRGRGARRWGLADEEGRDEGRFRQRREGDTAAPAAMVAAATGGGSGGGAGRMGTGIPLRNPREREKERERYIFSSTNNLGTRLVRRLVGPSWVGGCFLRLPPSASPRPSYQPFSYFCRID
jgi:hypothetical protein